MAYVKNPTWHQNANPLVAEPGSTPISAAAMNNLETQYQAVVDDILSGVASPVKDALIANFALRPRTTNVRPVGQGEILVNVMDHGGKNDGATDNNAAIEAAIAEIIARSGGSFGVAGRLYFPAGMFLDSGQHVIAAGQKIVVEMSGRASTVLRRVNGSTGDWWTFNAGESGILHGTLDGRRYQCPAGGANIVLNGAYTFAEDLFVNKANGSGIVIGQAAAAVVHSLTEIRVRECKEYGIYTPAGSGSTDGAWTGVEVGLCGKSGVRISTGSQNITALHIWGCGLEDATDKHGLWLDSQSNNLINVQSETNNGFGVYVTGSRNSMLGGSIWANYSTGIRGIGATYLVAIGVKIYRNATFNAASGSSSLAASGIYLTDTLYYVLVGNSVWDDTVAFTSVDYTEAIPGSVTAGGPTYPFPGRSAARSMVFAFTEDGTSDFAVIANNSAPKQLLRGSAGPYSFTGTNHRIEGNQWGTGLTTPTRTVSSVDVGGVVKLSVRVPPETDMIYVNAAVTIERVLGHRQGRRVTIAFNGSGTGQVTADAELDINGNMPTKPNAVLGLISDGVKWYETFRRVIP